MWGGLFNTYDCAVKGIRKKEDPWNAIIAGFFTGGSLAVRGGYRSMRNGAISCAILLAVIEGVSIGFNRMMADNTRSGLIAQAPYGTYTHLITDSTYHHHLPKPVHRRAAVAARLSLRNHLHSHMRTLERQS